MKLRTASRREFCVIIRSLTVFAVSCLLCQLLIIGHALGSPTQNLPSINSLSEALPPGELSSTSSLEGETKTILRGKVTDARGTPIEGARVQIISPPRYADTRGETNADGQFEMPLTAEKEPIHIVVKAETSDRQMIGVSASVITSRPSTKSLVTVDVRLYRKRELELMVVDDHQFAVEDAIVGLSQSGFMLLGPYRTNQRGILSVSLPDDGADWTLAAIKKEVGLASKTFKTGTAIEQPISLELMLDKPQPLRVQSFGVNGEPVVGARVTCSSFKRETKEDRISLVDFAESISETTDDTGEAWVDMLPTGTVSLVFQHPDYEVYTMTISHTRGAEYVHQVTLRGVSVHRCRVVDQSGNPLVNTKVNVEMNSLPIYQPRSPEITDHDGVLEFPVVVERPYMISVRSGNFGAATVTGFGTKTQSADEIQELRLGPLRTVTGIVKRVQTEEPVVDGLVYLTQFGASLDKVGRLRGAEKVAVWIRPQILHQSSTDETGRFRFEIPDGEYNLSLDPRENHSRRFVLPEANGQAFELMWDGDD